MPSAVSSPQLPPGVLNFFSAMAVDLAGMTENKFCTIPPPQRELEQGGKDKGEASEGDRDEASPLLRNDTRCDNRSTCAGYSIFGPISATALRAV